MKDSSGVVVLPSPAKWYGLISIVLVVASLAEIPRSLDMMRTWLPTDITAAQIDDMLRTMVRMKVLFALLAPAYHLVLIFLQAVILWAALVLMTGRVVTLRAAVTASVYPFAAIAIGNLVRSIALWALPALRPLQPATVNPFGLSFLKEWLPGSPVMAAALGSVDIFVLVYAVLLIENYRKLFTTNRWTCAAIVLLVNGAWVYFNSVLAMITGNLHVAS